MITVTRPDDRAESVGAAIGWGGPGESFPSGEPVMAKRIVLGGIVGGIVIFVWGFISHMLLPIGEMGVHKLPDEDAVISTVRTTIKEPGFYLFPAVDMSGKVTESEQQAMQEKLKQGPVGVVIVRPQGGEGLSPKLLLTELGANMVSALLAALVLSQVRVGARYATRVGLVTLLGLFAFVTDIVPYWNWYSFPTDFVVSEVIEHVVAMFLGGLALAAIVRTPKGKVAG
jgi:hypothetical protein